MLSESERGAMRAYLQRCEVRISTQHRIATAFISGAGLLLLVPIFFKDVIDRIIEVLLVQADPLFSSSGIIIGSMLYLVLFYPFLLSLFIPIYGFYLLLKDLVQFYYSIYMPGFSENLFNPTLALAPIMFSTDESETGKAAIRDYEYLNDHYMLPFSQPKRQRYFDDMMTATQGEILPTSRRAFNTEETRHFHAAMGLTRALDRTLVEEVAITEMTLIRNTLYLRRLVLRYIKTLLMFIWTMGVTFIMLPFLLHANSPKFFILALTYLIWSSTVMTIIRIPFLWFYRHRNGDYTYAHVDAQLKFLDENIRGYVYLAIASSGVGLVLSVWVG